MSVQNPDYSNKYPQKSGYQGIEGQAVNIVIAGAYNALYEVVDIEVCVVQGVKNKIIPAGIIRFLNNPDK